MKIIEILSEASTNWTIISNYNADRKGALNFTKEFYINELKKLAGFLIAWENYARGHNYTTKHATKARELTGRLIASTQTKQPTNEVSNIPYNLDDRKLEQVKSKLNDASMVFGSMSHDLQDNRLSLYSEKTAELASLLDKAIEEVGVNIGEKPVSNIA